LVEYSLLDSDGKPLECGIGTLATATTLARTFPLATYSGGTYDNTSPTAVSLSGTTTVICTGSPGAGFPFIQAMNTGATYKAVDSAHNSLNHSSTVAMTTNRLYVVPFLLTVNRPLAGIQCRVSTGSGTNGTLGLYRCGADGLPGALLQSGTITTSAGPSIQQVTFSAYYPPGWYYMACVADNACAINAPGAVPGSNPLGHDTNNQHIVALYTANGSLTLPDPFSGVTTNVVNSTAIPGVSALIV
jgi:hypothetical protein